MPRPLPRVRHTVKRLPRKRALRHNRLPATPARAHVANDERWYFEAIQVDEDDRWGPVAASGIMLSVLLGLAVWLLLFNAVL